MKEIKLTQENSLIQIPNCKFSATGLVIDNSVTFEEWEHIGKFLRNVESGVLFWIADWLVFGEAKWGEMYIQALQETDYTYGRLRNIKYVAESVDLSRRRDKLSFDHHQAVAPLEPEEQEKWLEKAEQEGLTRQELRTAIKRDKAIKNSPIEVGAVKCQIKLGDFRDLIKKVPDDSVDLILTDPPYAKEYLGLWTDLALSAKRILKPSGFLIAYSGQNHLPEVLNNLGRYLEYYWLMGLWHKGVTGQRFEVNMWNRFKPILIYLKPPRKKQNEWFEDLIISELPDKDKHEWGQSVEPFMKLIEYFSAPGDIVLDPMFGGGAVIEATIKSKRNFIGYEIEKESFESVKERIK